MPGSWRVSAGVAIFVSAREDKDHWVPAGRACKRFALQATALGFRHAFLNQPVEVAALRPQLAGLVGMSGRRPDVVMRFGYGPRLPYSPRRPVGAVLAPPDAYGLTVLPFTREQFFGIFIVYNEAIWPLQVEAYASDNAFDHSQ